jgi:hypothetical protein
MGKVIGQLQRGLRIRPADARAFKKTSGERKYNTIIKSHSTIQNLLGRQSFPDTDASNDPKNSIGAELGTITDTAASNDLDGPIMAESRYTKQMLTTIQGCLDTAEKHLGDTSVQVYLTNTFGEDNAQQILQESISIQEQLKQLFEQIKKLDASNPSTDIKNPPTGSLYPPTGSIGEVSGSKG